VKQWQSSISVSSAFVNICSEINYFQFCRPSFLCHCKYGRCEWKYQRKCHNILNSQHEGFTSSIGYDFKRFLVSNNMIFHPKPLNLNSLCPDCDHTNYFICPLSAILSISAGGAGGFTPFGCVSHNKGLK